MAAYSGTPTIARTWTETDRGGKYIRHRRRLSLSLSSQGGATNNIPATALGFRAGKLELVSLVSFVDGSAQKRAVFVWTDGTYLYVGDPQTSTDAARGEPTDVTGTLVVECCGIASNL